MAETKEEEEEKCRRWWNDGDGGGGEGLLVETKTRFNDTIAEDGDESKHKDKFWNYIT